MKLDIQMVPASVIATICYCDEPYELGTIFYNPQRDEKPYYCVAVDGTTRHFWAFQFAYRFLFGQFKERFPF